jgi:23S rRNA G2069 N7-methylase RlmK/C1962 C5-methylase RlmI
MGDSLEAEVTQVLKNLGRENWILKRRSADGGYINVWSKPDLATKVFWAQENDVWFQVRCDPKNDFGVFTDAKGARGQVAKIASGKSLLNLFSYTCGFGLVAKKHGALKTVNVDADREMLTWGKTNAERNNVDFGVIPETAQKYLRRLVKRKSEVGVSPFDIVVLDPPAFGVGRGNERVLRTLWPEFFENIVELNPQHVFVLFNDFAFRRQNSVTELIAGHFAKSHWKQSWHRWDGDMIRSQAEINAFPDPYFAPPVFVHLFRGNN